MSTSTLTRPRRASYGVNRDGWWVLEEHLTGRVVHGDYQHGPVDFNPDSASLRGRAGKGGTGQLPVEWSQIYRDSEVVFTVYSYATPVAWRVRLRNPEPGIAEVYKWVMPDVRYSQTTDKHQCRVRPALRNHL